MVAVLVLSFEAPTALSAVVIPELAEVERTTTEEVCVVMAPELFVSERLVLIDSLGVIPVETPNKMFPVSALLCFDCAGRAMNECRVAIPVGEVLGTAVKDIVPLAK